MNANSHTDHSGLRNLSHDSDEVARYYDDWAADYDRALTDWRYEAPERVAAILRAELPPAALVLDAGCGTGLSGRALAAAGFDCLDGMDVSARSVEIANARGIYRQVAQVDMQQLPLPYADAAYDGLACVGVLTYLPDSEAVLREFARVLKPGGIMALTQRDDILRERDFAATLDSLVQAGVLAGRHVSEPMPYLPDNAEFGDEVRVHYITCRVA